jgi:hypothetical protein
MEAHPHRIPVLSPFRGTGAIYETGALAPIPPPAIARLRGLANAIVTRPARAGVEA